RHSDAPRPRRPRGVVRHQRGLRVAETRSASDAGGSPGPLGPPGANLDGGRRPEERWRGCASGGHGVGSGRRRRRTRRPEHHQRGRARRGDAGWPSRDGLTIRMGAAPEKQGVWDWVKETFRGRGIVLILLALGVVFLLLGLTTGIELPF